MKVLYSSSGTGGSTGTYGANSWQQQQQIQLQRLQQQQAVIFEIDIVLIPKL